jgi:hypothetical protein
MQLRHSLKIKKKILAVQIKTESTILLITSILTLNLVREYYIHSVWAL